MVSDRAWLRLVVVVHWLDGARRGGSGCRLERVVAVGLPDFPASRQVPHLNQDPLRLTKLTKRVQFLQVARSGRKYAVRGLVLQANQTPLDSRRSESDVRYGITASRRVGNAVARNRVKRRLREVARRILPFKSEPGYDYVLIGRRQTLDRPFEKLVMDLEAALRRVGCYRKAA